MNTPPDTPATRVPRRRLVVGAVLAVVVAALVALTVTTGGPDRDASASTGTPTSSAPGTSAAATPGAPATSSASPSVVPAADSPQPTGPTGDADALPPSLPAVPLEDTAAVGNGVTAELVSLEAITGSGVGVGNIAGPALSVTVRIVNGTSAPLTLDGVSVHLTSGPDLTPAPPLGDRSAAPFSGTLDAGASAEGVYVFTIGTGDRDAVTVSVGYQAGAPIMVFTGPAD